MAIKLFSNQTHLQAVFTSNFHSHLFDVILPVKYTINLISFLFFCICMHRSIWRRERPIQAVCCLSAALNIPLFSLLSELHLCSRSPCSSRRFLRSPALIIRPDNTFIFPFSLLRPPPPACSASSLRAKTYHTSALLIFRTMHNVRAMLPKHQPVTTIHVKTLFFPSSRIKKISFFHTPGRNVKRNESNFRVFRPCLPVKTCVCLITPENPRLFPGFCPWWLFIIARRLSSLPEWSLLFRRTGCRVLQGKSLFICC